MQILILSPALPFPPHDGSKLILFNLLKQLSNRHQIDLITFVDPSDTQDNEQKIRQYCNQIITVPIKSQHSKLEKIYYHLSLTPYSVVKSFSKLMQAQILKTIKTKSYDILHFYGIDMLPYGLGINIPKIAFVADAVSLYFKRNIACEKNLVRKLLYFVEYLIMRRYERIMYRHFDRCVVVSEADKKALERHCRGAVIRVVPNGIDTAYFRPNFKRQENENPTLLFSGNMDYPPNIHAVLWFVREALPKVRAAFPDTLLYIVGRNPSSELELIADNRIIITGFVPDIRVWFDKADIYVCPMVSGTGIKNKLLEAMAMEKAIVASPLSLQGISVEKEFPPVSSADTSIEFSDRIIKFLQDTAFRKETGLKARKFVEDHYSWERSAYLLETIYQSIR